MTAMTAGITASWTSPVLPKLRNAKNLSENPLERSITNEEESWIGSLLALGGVFGPILVGIVVDKIGRKNTLLYVCGVPLAVSFFILAFTKTIIFYYIARFISGFATGATYTVLPMYNSEIAEDSIRGAVCSSMGMFITIGILFSYVIGPYTSVLVFSIICAVIPTAFVVLFFVFAPESPYYLLTKRKYKEAESCLKKLRGCSSDNVAKEMETIKNEVEDAIATKGSFRDIFKSRGLVKAFIISTSLVAFQQFSGISIVLFYTQIIFEATGSSIPPDISSIIIGSVSVVSSVIAPLLVDRLGRRYLFLISGIGMFLSEIPLGVYFYLQDNGSNVGSIFWLPVLCLFIYVVTYNMGYGPLPWTVMAEIFPANIKSAASIVTVSFCWFIAFMLTKFFSSVSESIGMAGSFWLFSGFCLLAVIFSVTYLIETKGRSFQEIQKILRNET